MKRFLFLLIVPALVTFAGNPKTYKTVSKAVVNGYLQTITTYHTPTVKNKKVAVLKNVYRNGVLYRREVVYENRPVVTWKKRAEYKYEPLIK